MNPRTEFAVILLPWIAFLCGLLAFCTWRDTRPLGPVVGPDGAALIR
jgi:hypothetical protein